MRFKFFTELSERVAFAKKNINQWIDISSVFKNVKYVAQLECFNNESTTIMDISEDSHVEFIILPTSRIGICIDSNYFIYSDTFNIRTLQDHALYELSCMGVLKC